jgi:hypothetical protein
VTLQLHLLSQSQVLLVTPHLLAPQQLLPSMHPHWTLGCALGSSMRLQVSLMKLLVRLATTPMSRQQAGIRRMACLLST